MGDPRLAEGVPAVKHIRTEDPSKHTHTHTHGTAVWDLE